MKPLVAKYYVALLELHLGAAMRAFQDELLA